jgi:hypothetical protein
MAGVPGGPPGLDIASCVALSWGYVGFDHAQEPDRLYKRAPIMSIASQNETTRDRTAMIHQAFWNGRQN